MMTSLPVYDDVTSGLPRSHVGRAKLEPKLGPRPQNTLSTRPSHVRHSDWSKLDLLQSDWLRRIPFPYTTLAKQKVSFVFR